MDEDYNQSWKEREIKKKIGLKESQRATDVEEGSGVEQTKITGKYNLENLL